MTAPAAPSTPTPAQYNPGWVKQDVFGTLASATRTSVITALNDKDWLVATLDHGGHYASWDDVSHWIDLSEVPVAQINARFSGGDGTGGLSAVGVVGTGTLEASNGTTKATAKKNGKA